MSDHHKRTQAGLLLVFLALGLTLAACGKKPGQIDPPPDLTEDHFPRTYPDPAMDPKP